jgi:DNA-binding transcriptional ArsR family regulator
MSDTAYHAIAEPRRRDILRLIQETELTAGEIAAHFDVTRPAISQHLRILAEAQLVSMRQAGTRRYYQARPEGLEDVREFLDAFWESRLSRLKKLAEEEERGIDSHGFSRQ